MSSLLEHRVYAVLSETPKRGVYPTHAYREGLFRIPVNLIDKEEIKKVVETLKKDFEIDEYADRIYVTYRWKEKDYSSPNKEEWKEEEMHVSVEIVTGEVVDIIYQILPQDYFPKAYWVKSYREKLGRAAKMVLDTILLKTIIGNKWMEQWMKKEGLSEEEAQAKLYALTPMAKGAPKKQFLAAPEQKEVEPEEKKKVEKPEVKAEKPKVEPEEQPVITEMEVDKYALMSHQLSLLRTQMKVMGNQLKLLRRRGL